MRIGLYILFAAILTLAPNAKAGYGLRPIEKILRDDSVSIIDATVDEMTEQGHAKLRINETLKGNNPPSILKSFCYGTVPNVERRGLRSGKRYIFLVRGEDIYEMRTFWEVFQSFDGELKCYYIPYKQAPGLMPKTSGLYTLSYFKKVLKWVIESQEGSPFDPPKPDDSEDNHPLYLQAKVNLVSYSTTQLFDTLKSKSAKWYVRKAVADELQRRSPEEVLPHLLPLIFVSDQGTGAYQGPLSFQAAEDLSWPISMRYTAKTAWRQMVRNAQPLKGRTLLKLLEQDLPADQGRLVLEALTTQFIPEAEKVLLAITENSTSSYTECLLAARALLTNQPDKYYGHFVQVAQSSSFTKKKALFKTLTMRSIKSKKPDERVIRIGFELLAEFVDQNPDSPRKAYDLVGDLGSYVGVTFFANDRQERYEKDGYLKEDYFQNAVENAQRWWKGWQLEDKVVRGSDAKARTTDEHNQ